MTTDSPAGRRRRVVALVGLVLAIVACGSSPNAASPTGSSAEPMVASDLLAPGALDTSGPAPLPTEPAPVVETQPSIVSPTTTSPLLCSASAATWDIGGHSALVRVPTTTSPVPLILALHGYKGTPEGVEYYSELNAAAESGEAVVAYLSGGTALDLGFGWNSGSTRLATTGVDDVAYIAEALDQLEALPCVDPSNVSLLGESNGGGMAVRAVCDPRLSGRVQRLVLVNAAIDDGVLGNCFTVEPPVEVLATAGLVDSVVPADGSRDPFLAVDDWFSRVAVAVGGCDPSRSAGDPVSDNVTVFSGAGCGRCVTMFEVADGGHTWPGSFEGSNGHPVGTLEFTTMLRERVRSGPGDSSATCR